MPTPARARAWDAGCECTVPLTLRTRMPMARGRRALQDTYDVPHVAIARQPPTISDVAVLTKTAGSDALVRPRSVSACASGWRTKPDSWCERMRLWARGNPATRSQHVLFDLTFNSTFSVVVKIDLFFGLPISVLANISDLKGRVRGATHFAAGKGALMCRALLQKVSPQGFVRVGLNPVLRH